MAKSWTFYKNGYQMILSIDSRETKLNIMLQLNNDKVRRSISVKDIIDKDENTVIRFRVPTKITIDNKIKYVSGIVLANFDKEFNQVKEVKSYFLMAKQGVENRLKEIHDKEYNEILSGRRPLDIEYFQGEYWSGAIVYGISEEVVKDLHCGRNLDGVGFMIYPEFEDGDIQKMKKHFQKWKCRQENIKRQKEMERIAYEKEKKSMLNDVEWKTTEHIYRDEDGNTKYYIHDIKINGKSYKFTERNAFDIGRLINPCYSIKPGLEPGGLITCKNDKYYWMYFENEKGWYIVREVTSDELHAYNIVSKYGNFSKSKIRM